MFRSLWYIMLRFASPGAAALKENSGLGRKSCEPSFRVVLHYKVCIDEYRRIEKNLCLYQLYLELCG